jgi:hypothetical protein
MTDLPTAVTEPPRLQPPRWARAADFLSLALLILAALIATSGGFRIRVANIRLALTSPYRLLAWAFAIAALRHALVRRPPIYRDLPAVVAQWWRTAAVRASLAAVVGTRPAVMFVGYLAIFQFGFANGQAPIRFSNNEIANLPIRFDGGWYFGIAADGYQYRADAPPDLQQNIVFFPAYPIVVRGVGRLLLGGQTPGYLAAFVIVSLASLFGALVYLYFLARDSLDDEGARAALWLTAAYPFAVFYGAAYTEAFFLLGATGAFYHFTRTQHWRAAFWALLVGLTRPNGFLLAAPLATMAISPWLPAWLVGGRRGDGEARSTARLVNGLLVAACPAIGVGIYTLFIWQLTGNPLAWFQGHAAWGRHYEGLAVVVTDRIGFIERAGWYYYTSVLQVDLLNALGAIFVLAAAWPVARRLGLAYAVFILINILPPISAGGLMSVGRFSAVLFPAFIWLAMAVPPKYRTGWVATFALVQAYIATTFYTWRPPY